MSRLETLAIVYLLLGWAPAGVVAVLLRSSGAVVPARRVAWTAAALAVAIYAAVLIDSGGPTLIGLGGLGFLVFTLGLAIWAAVTLAIVRRLRTTATGSRGSALEGSRQSR